MREQVTHHADGAIASRASMSKHPSPPPQDGRSKETAAMRAGKAAFPAVHDRLSKLGDGVDRDGAILRQSVGGARRGSGGAGSGGGPGLATDRGGSPDVQETKRR